MHWASCRAEEMLIRDESLLLKKNELFQKLTETTSSAIFVLRDKFLYVNPAAVAITGYSEEELLAMPGWEAIIHPDYQQSLKDRVSARLAGENVPQRDEICIITRDGDNKWLDYTANVIDHNGEAAILGTAIDITGKRNAETRLRLSEEKFSKTFHQERTLAELTLNSIGDGVIRTDNTGSVVYINQIASEILGVEPEYAPGQPVTGLVRLLDEITNASANSIINDALVSPESYEQKRHIVRLLGREQIYEIKLSPIVSPDDGVSGIVIVLHDITELRVMAKQLSYQVTHDDLTGLTNRRSFEESLTVILDQVHTQKRKHVLCYIDLDRFKYINDAGGHLAGDELLRQISVLMQRYVTATDILARLGSDEFVIIYEDCTLNSAIEEAKELLDAIRNFVFRWQGKSYYIGASMGIVRLGKELGTLRDVMSAADAACYAAKGDGRDRIHVFTRNDIESIQQQDEVKWLEHIRDSITQQHFVLYYQSIEAISDRVKSHGRHCELLLRMHSNDGDLVLPQDFILVAERYNLMPMLDRWVVSKALSVIANDAITSEMKMDEFSINLSGQSIGDDRFLEYVINEIRKSGVDPRKLCFEVTETAAIANMDSASKFLKKLRKLGCKFALDDFGRGLSSFSYLKNLTVDYLKIDGSFIRDLNYDSTDWAMVEAINQVGHAMNIPTVAEYVSDYDILSAVKKLGIDFAQGLHISVPCPVPGTVGIITDTESPSAVARSSQNK